MKVDTKRIPSADRLPHQYCDNTNYGMFKIALLLSSAICAAMRFNELSNNYQRHFFTYTTNFNKFQQISNDRKYIGTYK